MDFGQAVYIHRGCCGTDERHIAALAQAMMKHGMG